MKSHVMRNDEEYQLDEKYSGAPNETQVGLKYSFSELAVNLVSDR
jgi:hypothetical protein